MQSFTLLSIALGALLVHASPVSESGLEARANLEARAACNGHAGECVTYFSGPDCDSNKALSSYLPTCGGNCFQYSSFYSLLTSGSAVNFKGTACTVYSDNNCQHEIANLENKIPTRCASFSQANSMKCYYDC